VFQVRARNAYGDGTWSDASTAAVAHVAPSVPTGLAATAGDGEVSLSWTASSTGAPPPRYDIRYRTSGSIDWTVIAGSPVSGTSHTVGSLTNGIEYEFQVRAANQDSANTWHRSGWTASVTATPATTPGKPSAPTVAVRSATSLRVSWTAPPTGGTTWAGVALAVGTATSHTVTGLTPGTAYMFQVRATNGVGNGAWSDASASATPSAVPTPTVPAHTAPSSPTGLSATAGDGEVLLSWTASPGTPVPGYDIRYRTTGSGDDWTVILSQRVSGTGHTVSSLTNGIEYEFQVRALNQDASNVWHRSAWTASVTATPDAVVATPGAVPGKPSAPTVTVLSATSVRVSWAAPSNPCAQRPWRRGVVGLLDGGDAGDDAGQAVGSDGGGTECDEPAGELGGAADRRQRDHRLRAAAQFGRRHHLGGSAITGYVLRQSADGGTSWTDVSGVSGTGTSFDVPGLTPGTAYVFQVLARNAGGDGA
jgi:hypothetical protein